MPERCRVGSLGCLKSALTVLIVPSWLDIGLSHQPVWHRADLCLSLALSLLLPHTHPHTWRMRARIEAIAKNPTLSATPPSGVRTTPPPRERGGEREPPFVSCGPAPAKFGVRTTFGVWGLGFGVWGLGVGVRDLGFRPLQEKGLDMQWFQVELVFEADRLVYHSAEGPWTS